LCKFPTDLMDNLTCIKRNNNKKDVLIKVRLEGVAYFFCCTTKY